MNDRDRGHFGELLADVVERYTTPIRQTPIRRVKEPNYAMLNQFSIGYFSLRHRLSGGRLIQCQKPLKDGLISKVAGPAISGRDGRVKFRVAGGKPGGTFVVELCQGACFEARSTFGVTRHKARIVALIDERAVIERILRHMGLWAQGVRVSPSTGPPEPVSGERIIEPWLDDPFPDYDTEPVMAYANG